VKTLSTASTKSQLNATAVKVEMRKQNVEFCSNFVLFSWVFLPYFFTAAVAETYNLQHTTALTSQTSPTQ
jgi:hypothetical protein